MSASPGIFRSMQISSTVPRIARPMIYWSSDTVRSSNVVAVSFCRYIIVVFQRG